jgi:RimJ/RimL family protein N-acetyltransferase
MILEPATDEDFQCLLRQEVFVRSFSVAPQLASPEVLEIVRQLPANWLMISNGELAGIIGLKTQDSLEQVEIGYGVAASRWSRGLAAAAVAALLPILKARGIQIVRAETSVENPASQKVLERNAFVRTGERVDEEDGPLILWQRSL